jgi:hypothetical protein
VSESVVEATIMRRPWLTSGCCAMKKNSYIIHLYSKAVNYSHFNNPKGFHLNIGWRITVQIKDVKYQFQRNLEQRSLRTRQVG